MTENAVTTTTTTAARARNFLSVNPQATAVAECFQQEAGRAVPLQDVAHLLDIDKTLRTANSRCCTLGCIGEQVFAWFFVALCLPAALFVIAKLFNFPWRG